jgi:hypothetical protein
MSAKHVFDHAPIGSIVAWSDGSPRPPERHRKKLSAWQANNSRGRLIQKQDERRIGNVVLSAGFTLHEGDFGSGGVTVIRVHRTFSASSVLQFTVVECPPVGSVRIFDRAGPGRELVHLAMSRPDAEAWLGCHAHPHAVLEEVSTSDVGAAEAAGRAA